jgi:hypothetical protein
VIIRRFLFEFSVLDQIFRLRRPAAASRPANNITLRPHRINYNSLPHPKHLSI